MSKPIVDSDQGKWEVVKKLSTPEGRRDFMGSFEIKLASYRKLIEKGGDFLVRKEAEDMKTTADQIRDQEPEAAKFIDEAREKIEELLTHSASDRSAAE